MTDLHVGARCLVTGGMGFIGSALSMRLLELGARVIAIDDLSTPSPLSHLLLENDRFSLLKADIRDADLVYSRLRELDISELDAVFHMACPAAPFHYSKDPVKTLTTCSQGTLVAIEIALAANARFLLASTSEIYGDPIDHPQREDHWGNVNPVGPRSMYDEGKRFAEALTVAASRHRGLDSAIARIFNTYGPGMRMDDGRLIPNILSQALASRPMTIYGSGAQTRSMAYVGDTVDAIVLLMESEVPGPINIGSDEEHTILEIAHIVSDLLEIEHCIEISPLPQDDPRRRRPDITAAKSLLGWFPKTALKEGLLKTIRDCGGPIRDHGERSND